MSPSRDETNIAEIKKPLALVVGVNQTNSKLLPPLEHAISDAKNVADVLQNMCGFELCMPPLLGEQATSDALKKAVRLLARDRTDDDFLLFYFSGHGQPMTVEANRHSVYLGSSDFNERDVEEEEPSHVSFHWLRYQLYELTKAGRVLLILDCCFSGDMGRSTPDHYLEELRARIKHYFEGPSSESSIRSGGLRLALTATGHTAIAFEENKSGLMTSYLLPALRGEITDVLEVEQQGAISLQRLHRYLELAMPPKQKPSLSGDFAGRSCILAYYPDHIQNLPNVSNLQATQKPTTSIPPSSAPLLSEEKHFDVFLCHNSKDKPAVKEIAKQLQVQGIVPWLDEWELLPGRPWQRELERQIGEIRSAAVFIGSSGLGPWQHMEMEAFLREFIHSQCPVIPVLLKNAPRKPELPIFLKGMTWVDFRQAEPDPLKQLIRGIIHKNPDKQSTTGLATPRQTPPTPKSLSLATRIELVNALLACRPISNRDSRETVLSLLNVKFPGITDAIPRRSDSMADVMEIVSTCSNNPGSLEELISIISYFEGEHSINTQRLKTFMESNTL